VGGDPRPALGIGQWWQWCTSHWSEVEHRDVRAGAYAFTEHAVYTVMTKGGPETRPGAPNRYKVADLLEALAAACHLPDAVAQPCWTDPGVEQRGPVVACANGLLDVHERVLLAHDPRFFNQVAVPFAYEPDAPEPERWLGFLDALWGDDRESVAALQQWFGYVISGRLDLHKILLLVGPTRAGKGVIARVLEALIGPANSACPTLSSLGGEFGLAPLLGKSLAVIADARLNGRDSSVVVERLLSISGQDLLTVNRKHRDQWTGTLPARLMLLSNELPELGDASAAIAGRFIPLLLTESWLGREDPTLESDLHLELPAILNWGLDGLEARSVSANSACSPAASASAKRSSLTAGDAWRLPPMKSPWKRAARGTSISWRRRRSARGTEAVAHATPGRAWTTLGAWSPSARAPRPGRWGSGAGRRPWQGLRGRLS
jgi:putative DNA primase/helicase